ncbi:MAG: FHA domain-containing protein [Pirellulaceae bacterium]|jgi:pSer/pThr/pTyr-binding forkhead associated (FHA) protein|nr:FHA domain-containing protein [Pirellulaceae bacterium]
MICVLDVTAGPARGKRFWLRSNQQIEIGRLSSADFAIPADPHMSRRHLILEGTLTAFRVRDVGSVNGTFVNNAKVNTLELCSGDRIRAGESTFEVSVLDDQENPHAKDGLSFSTTGSVAVDMAQANVAARNGNVVQSKSELVSTALDDSSVRNAGGIPSSSAGGVPVRVLNCQELDDSDAEITRRCVNAESPVGSSSRGSAHFGTVLSNNSWWSDYDFRITDVPCLLDEASKPEPGDSLLPEILRRLEPEFALTAIVDVERLGSFGRQQVGVLVEQGLVEWHMPSICSVLDNRSSDFVRLIESSLCQDAILLIGSCTPLDAGWLRELIAQAHRPSILNTKLREPNSPLIEQLLCSVEFVIFERDRCGRLSLLLRDLIELSE